MIRVALDSNVLIYAEIEPDSEKGIRSAELILQARGMAHTGASARRISPVRSASYAGLA